MLKRLQIILVDACCAPDPSQALAAALPTYAAELEPHERDWLRTIDRDGLALTGLLVRQSRLHRVLDGDPVLRAKHENEPDMFAVDFEEYHEAVSPVCHRAEDEARAFQEFMDLLG